MLTVGKLQSYPSGANDASDYERSEDKDFKTPGFQPVEFYGAENDGVDAVSDVQTGFNHVQGGYVANFPVGDAREDIEVKPHATDPTIATISGLPLVAENYFIVVWGEKNPEGLV